MVVLTVMIAEMAIACTGGSEEPTLSPSPTKTPTERPTPITTFAPTPTPEAANGLERLKLELAENGDLWESQEIENYRFEYRRIRFCLPAFVAPVEISMVCGIINKAISLEDGPAARGLGISRYETVEELFDWIQNATDRNAYSLLVAYAGGVG